MTENQDSLIREEGSLRTPRRAGNNHTKFTHKSSKVQTKLSRQPLGEILLNTPDKHGKMRKSGYQEKKKKESATQTESSSSSIDKVTQTKSIDEQMITNEVPPAEYWEIVAEQRRKALLEALEENKTLCDEIERLEALLEEKEHKCQTELPYFALFYKTLKKDES